MITEDQVCIGLPDDGVVTLYQLRDANMAQRFGLEPVRRLDVTALRVVHIFLAIAMLSKQDT